MAELTEIEIAMVNKLKNYYHSTIIASLQTANAAIPDFVGDDVHKQEFLDALTSLENDNEYTRALKGEAVTLLMNAIAALDAQTKIDLGIDHLFP